jgi:hypothetical protein
VRLLVFLSLALNALLISIIIRQWRHRDDFAQDAVGWHLSQVPPGSWSPIETLARNRYCFTLGPDRARKAVIRLRRKGRVAIRSVLNEQYRGKFPSRSLEAGLTSEGRKQLRSGPKVEGRALGPQPASRSRPPR